MSERVNYGLSLCFKVTLDDHTDLGSWTKCDGLGVEYDVQEVKEGGNNDYVHRLPGRAKYQNLKLTRPIDKDTQKVADWLASVASRPEAVHRRDRGPRRRRRHGRELEAPGHLPDPLVRAHPRHRDERRGPRGARAGPQRVRTLMLSGGALQKAMLKVVDGDPKTLKLPFMYNPAELTTAKSANWNRPQQKGAGSAGRPQFTGAGPQTVQMEIWFDAWDAADADVAKCVMTLFEWTKPTPSSITKKLPRPPVLGFEWGSNPILADLKFFLKTVNAKYVLFKPDGTPVRASATISLEEVPEDPPGPEPDVRVAGEPAQPPGRRGRQPALGGLPRVRRRRPLAGDRRLQRDRRPAPRRRRHAPSRCPPPTRRGGSRPGRVEGCPTTPPTRARSRSRWTASRSTARPRRRSCASSWTTISTCPTRSSSRSRRPPT